MLGVREGCVEEKHGDCRGTVEEEKCPNSQESHQAPKVTFHWSNHNITVSEWKLPHITLNIIFVGIFNSPSRTTCKIIVTDIKPQPAPVEVERRR